MVTPFEGLRMLDMARLGPGPICSSALADLGVDVLVVEPPQQVFGNQSLLGGSITGGEPAAGGETREDRMRRVDPPGGHNKRSIVLNLREPEARELFYRLCEDVDIVQEGFRPGVVEELGVGYETISKINARIVYCAHTGYGQTGPYRDMAGHDINYISIAGLLGSVGRAGQKPAMPLNFAADNAGGGMVGAFAIAAALFAREHTGRGQYIDMAMSDGVMYLLSSMPEAGLEGPMTGPMPGESPLTGALPHYDVYETSDAKWISVGALEPKFFAKLCEMLGREDLIPHAHEFGRREEIREFFTTTFRTKTREAWFEQFRDVDALLTPVYTITEAVSDPHNVHRMVVEAEDPQGGTVKALGIGPKLSETPGEVRWIAPRVGEHTDEVLRSLGYDDGAISSLRERGVVE